VAEELLTNVIFSMSGSAVRDVAINGMILAEQRGHPLQNEIVEAFGRVQRRVGAEL
jgi:hypothetical protein